MSLIKKYVLLILLSGVLVISANAQQRPGFIGKYNFIGLEKDVYWEGLFKSDPGVPIKKLNLPTLKFERMMNRVTMLGASLNYSKYTFEDKVSDPFTYSGNDALTYNNSVFFPANLAGKYHSSSISLGFHKKKYYRTRSYLPFGFYRMFDIGVVNTRVTVPKGYIFKDYNDIEYRTEQDWQHNFRQIYVGFNFGKAMPLYSDKLILNASFGATAKTRLDFINNEIYEHFLATVSDYLNYYHFFNIKLGVSYAL